MTAAPNSGLAGVRQRIAEAERRCARPPGSVLLLAVSKTHGAAQVRAAFAQGQRDFGESYLQEAVAKMEALADLPITWHFIGPIQSNKTRQIAAHFDWVHSLERAKLAHRLNDQRPAGRPPLNVCIQVNVSGEASKSGVAPGEVAGLAREIAALPRLRLRGLMAIPAPCADFAGQRRAFHLLGESLEGLCAAGFPLDTLSMGMSDDLEAAVAEGATIVRIGTAVFGERDSSGKTQDAII